MSRIGGKHALVVALTLLVLGAVAFLLWDSETSKDVDAPPPADAPSTPKPARVASTKARRTKPAAATSPDAPRAVVVVRVVASTTRAAIAGAAVYVTDGSGDDWRSETDADGAARFDELAVGDSTVHAEATGRVPANRTAALVAGANKDVEVALDDAVAVEGTVVDADAGVALAGATVQLMVHSANDRLARPIDETTTDAAGRFRFAGAPARDEVTFVVTAPDHARGMITRNLRSASGGGAAVDFRLDRTGTLRGIVRDPDGRPADGAWVHAAWTHAPGSAGLDELTDDGGAFVVHGVPVGAALVMTAGAPGWADAAPIDAPVLQKTALDATVDLSLRRAATLVIRVIDPNGGVVARAAASLDGSWQSSFTSNGDPALVRKGVAPGKHRLMVSAAGFPDLERDVVIAEGERVEIVAQLVAGVAVSGVVVDEVGSPVADASIYVVEPEIAATISDARRLPSRSSPGARVGDDGVFRLEAVAPGRRALVAFSGFGDVTTCVIDAPADGVRIVVPAIARFVLHVAMPADAAGPKQVHVVPVMSRTSPSTGFGGKSPLGLDLSDWSDKSVVRGAVAPNAVGLSVSVEGYVPVLVAMRPERGRVIDLGEVRLVVGVTLRGRVVDGAGRPVARVAVHCFADGSRVSASTAADGSFELAHVARGRDVLRVFAGTRSGHAVVEAIDDTAPIVVVVRETGTLNGVVVDAAGVPIKDAAVVVEDAFADPKDAGLAVTATTDANGAFAANVAAGRCRVSVGDSSAETNVPEGGESSVRLVVQSR